MEEPGCSSKAPFCHAERSEVSLSQSSQILRFAQDDTGRQLGLMRIG